MKDLTLVPLHDLKSAVQVLDSAVAFCVKQAKEAHASHGTVSREFLNPVAWAEHCEGAKQLIQQVIAAHEEATGGKE